MSLTPRTSAPGKARRAASVGKPKRAKKAAFKAADPKARHTTAQKNARKRAATTSKTGKPASTRRYSDVDSSTQSKKQERLTDRSNFVQSASKKRQHQSHVRLRLQKSVQHASNNHSAQKAGLRSLLHSAIIALSVILIRKKSLLSQKIRSLNIRSQSSKRANTRHQILAQPIAVMQQKQRFHVTMMVVQTLCHVR
ncbi:hypothetical protein EMGBS9_00500 [Actinomycetota bacterium]|nr:hypothetical protein EMGBS9_00500 [Actinomycetota bacterium]